MYCEAFAGTHVCAYGPIIAAPGRRGPDAAAPFGAEVTAVAQPALPVSVPQPKPVSAGMAIGADILNVDPSPGRARARAHARARVRLLHPSSRCVK